MKAKRSIVSRGAMRLFGLTAMLVLAMTMESRAAHIIVTASNTPPNYAGDLIPISGSAMYSALPYPAKGASVTITMGGTTNSLHTWSTGNYETNLAARSAGVYTARVYVTDYSVSGTNTLVIAVLEKPKLGIATTSLPTGMEEVEYSAALSATSGVSPYAWSSTPLPDGLTLSSAGAISGTPTQAGTNTVTFTVQDSVGATTNRALQIRIAVGMPAAPVASEATDIAAGSFSANWGVSAKATNYFLDVATNSGFSSCINGYQNRRAGNVTTCSVTGLTVNSTYYYRLRAQNSSGTSTNSNTIAVFLPKADQAIAFPAIGDQRTTNAVTLTATASSGLPVSFAVASGPASLNGATLTFSGAGSVAIVASQAGNENWNPAPDVTNAFSVAKAVAAVTLNGLAQTYDGTARSAAAATDPVGLSVALSYDGEAAPPTHAGSYTVVGTVDSAMYQGGATGTLVVAAANQTIAFPAIGNQLPTDTVELAATASSGLPVVFSVAAGPAQIAEGTSLSFSGTGPVSIVASQAGDGNWNPAVPVTNTFLVSEPPEITTASMPSGMERMPYSATLAAVGGVSPYQWSIEGALPPGLSLATNGELSGRPTLAGTYPVTFAVQDAVGRSGQRILDIVIEANTNGIYTALYHRGQPLATYAVGDALDYQFEFAINTDTTGWVVEYGVGQNADGSDWTWYPADWSRMDGSDNRVWISKLSAHQFTSPGTRYYAGRFVNGGDIYYAATDWKTNCVGPLAAESYFMVTDLEPPSAMARYSATYPATRADLTWSSWKGKNVLITMTTDWQEPAGAPEQRRAYVAGETFGNQTVVSGSQGGSTLEVAGLMPNSDYVFTFYTENNSYYSFGTSSHVITLTPQARNTGGGPPEAPAEVFLGDAGLTFGCDTWGTLDQNWGRIRMWMESPDLYSWVDTGWSEYTDTEHKTVQSGVFNCTGTWNYGFQVDYGLPYGENFWFGIESSEWTDLIPAPVALMTVTVQPIFDPVNVRAEFYSGWEGNGREVILDWSANERGDNVMIVRKRAEDVWTEPTQRQFYWIGDTIGAGTVIKSAREPVPFVDQDDLETGASYDYKFYSVNESSMNMLQWPEAGAYYSPGVEVRVDIPLAPVIATETLPEGEEMTPYSCMLEATGEFPPMSWTAAGLPDGLSCSSSGEVSGIPTQAGTYSVTFTVRDFNAGTMEKTFDLVIQPNPNLRPVIESSAPAAGAFGLNEGASQLFTVSAQDPEGSNLVYTWTWDGAVVGSNDFRYERSAAWGDAGTHALRCTVSDGLWTQTVFAEWSVTIVDLPLEITTLSLPSGRVGEAYEASLTATNGVSPYGWFALEPTNVAAWGDTSYGRCAVPLSLTNAVAVDAGGEHSLALKSDGTVAVWGRNIWGQTNMPAGVDRVVAISAGADHNLALKSDGTVVAWGRNSSGQTNVPNGLSNVVAVAGGHSHSLALKSNGTVVAWGNNSYGQTNVPADLTNANAIASLNFHSLALKADGTVVGWGRNNYGQTNVPAGLSDVVAIAVGVEHSMALKSDGTVVAWGRNNYGQTNVPAGLSDVVAIAAGLEHGVALKSDGTLVAWGRNNYGQANMPAGLSNVVAISSGWAHNLAIFSQTAPRQMPDGLTCSENGMLTGTPTQVGTNRVRFFVRDSVGTATNRELEIVVQPALPALMLSQTNVNLREGGEGRFFVRLNQAPEVNVAVSVSRSAGHSSLWVKSGATRTFTPANWSAWQVVTLAASDDANADGETATFRISSPGAADQFVAATALDDDVGENLALASGGATIAGKQSDKAGQAIDGIHLASSNYGSTFWTNVPPGTMTLDLQAATAVSRIRLLTYDWNYRSHRYVVESSLDGATWSNLVDAATGEHRGWEEWAAAGRTARYLRFTGLSNSTTRAVCVAEWEVYGERIPVLSDQTIDFPSIPDQTPAGVVALAATASSGLPVSFAVASGPGSLAGTTLTFTGTGSVSIVASQAGNGSWNPAPDATNMFAVAYPPPQITTTSLPSGMVGVAYGANLEATNGVPPYTWKVQVLSHVVTWGNNLWGQLYLPADLENLAAISAGGYHSLGLKIDGTVVAWGSNLSGQCNVPAGLSDVTAIAGGYAHSLALKSDGVVIAWGADESGQCNVPAGLSNVVGIAAGSSHNLALRSNGAVVAWGNNEAGQCNVPAGLTNVIKIAAGVHHSLALKSDGTVVAWGYNGGFQCNVPAGLTGVVAISGGYLGSCALKSDGTVVGWGSGQEATDIPAGLSHVVAIAAGETHALALESDGTVVIWGANGLGQCDMPSGLTGVVAISAGTHHSLALRMVSPTLPEGLSCSIDGMVSGTPTQAGTNLVTFVVRDSIGTTTNKELEIVIQPVPPVSSAPMLSQTNVNVREGGEGRFFVRLNQAPEGNVAVSVSRSAGHPSLWVKSGATRTFTPANWSTWQVVTLAASDDANADGETAIFRISSPGAADQFVAATALDDDVGENLALASGGTTISGQQSDKAGQAIDGIHLASANYGSTFWTNVPPGTMTLDLQAATAVSRIRLLTYDWNYRSHRYVVESSLDGATWSNLVDAATGEHRGWEEWAAAGRTARYLRFTGLSNSTTRAVCVAEWEVYGERIPVLADQTIDFPSIPDQTTAGVVALAATASSGLPVSFAVASGPGSLAGATLTFTGEGSVTIVASQAGNGAWNPAPDVSRTFNVIRPSAIPEISQTNVNVREGGEGRFFVRLNQAPEGNVAVSVSRSAGHPSLWVKSGATRTFTPANWSAWQVVTLAAADDENADGETATFRISSPGAADQFVAATALDDDVGENLALASGGATIAGKQSDKAGQAIDGIHLASSNYGSTFWTNVPPGTMTLDLQAATAVSRIRLLTYDWNYRSHRYVVESSLDGATWSNLVDAATGEHRGWEDWVADGRTARYLRFTGLSNSTTRAVCVAEWEVYGERPAAAKAMVLPKRESIAPAPEQGPAAPEIFTTTVLTSDGTEDETGWNAVDGDEATAWVGQKVGGGYIVAEYQPALELSALEVALDEGSLTNIQYLYSADAQNWQPLPDDLESNPISLNYLWLVFPGDGSAAVPHVLEIVPNP